MEDGEEGTHKYSYLGKTHYILENFKDAVDYHERHLKVAKEMEDRAEEGRAYGYLGSAYYSLGDFKNAIEYQERCLNIAIEVGDSSGEGNACCALGEAHRNIGEFRKAKDYYERYLKFAKECRDRAEEGRAYLCLGYMHNSLGNFQKAIACLESNIKIAKEIGDKASEGGTYGGLGNAYYELGYFKKAIEFHERSLKTAIEVGNKADEGAAYGNLGNAHHNIGEFIKAIDYHERHLRIAKEYGDRAAEGCACANLGNAQRCLGDFKSAIDYHERDLKIAKDVGDRAGEGVAYGNLGKAHCLLGNFKNAINYYERQLMISKDVGARVEEGAAYSNLGNAYLALGDYKKAIRYHDSHLKITKEITARAQEGTAYGNLGSCHLHLGKLKEAIDYHERHLTIAIEVGDRAGEGRAYGNIGDAYQTLGDNEKSIDYFERCLKIIKEVGDRLGEGRTYGYLGVAHCSLGDFKKGIDYKERCLNIAKEVGDKIGEGSAYCKLGTAYDSLGDWKKAIDHYQGSVTTFNDVRSRLELNDEWKICLRNTCNTAYAGLWRALLKEDKVVEALLSAEQGRAQALSDLMEIKYRFQTTSARSETVNVITRNTFKFVPSKTVFIGIDEKSVIFWAFENGDVKLRNKQIRDGDVTTFLQSLVQIARQEIAVKADLKCEDRSLEIVRDEKAADERSTVPQGYPPDFETNALRVLYDVTLGPVADLLHGKEVIVVPEGPLCLAPYAAFMDSNSMYLCQSFRIRVFPSLTSLKLITDCAADYHSNTGALLVGDPWVQEVTYQGTKLQQLPCAREEVQMIGEILQTVPLIGGQATKGEVLKRLSSVALVHIAAHGKMETGEIALTPNPPQPNTTPVEEDFLLTMKDVLNVQLRARLVVLSCCHSARGEIKAEGVVGIARAFLGAGARSVLVSLWAIDDEATLEFMKSFYRHLVKGRSASEALNQAMKFMRESDNFSAVKYWAPFVLIGDDVTLDFSNTK